MERKTKLLFSCSLHFMFRRPTTSAVRTFDIHIVCGRWLDGENKKISQYKVLGGELSIIWQKNRKI